jgi:hypothetical protein
LTTVTTIATVATNRRRGLARRVGITHTVAASVVSFTASLGPCGNGLQECNQGCGDNESAVFHDSEIERNEGTQQNQGEENDEDDANRNGPGFITEELDGHVFNRFGFWLVLRLL